MTRVLGLDYGRRRIGMATTDPDGVLVTGLATLDTRRTPDVLAAVAAIVESESPDRIVMGLPLGGDDRETAMSREVREFASRLSLRVGKPVEFVDESFSSAHAQQILRDRPRKHRRDKASVDRIAACLIVEDYLRILAAEHGAPPAGHG